MTGTPRHITRGMYHVLSNVILDQGRVLRLGHMQVDVETINSSGLRISNLLPSSLWYTFGKRLLMISVVYHNYSV